MAYLYTKREVTSWTLYNKPANVDHLKVFDCLCYARNLPKGDKFSQRGMKTVLIGYSTKKGIHIVWFGG